MKGYYQIRIRRAANGAVRQYNFHNHIMPDFYEILVANSVTDNDNSVIDTLVLGNGVGSHATNATVLNGDIVYEKKYNNYHTPTNLTATTASTEFAHTLQFNALHSGESFQVGEVAIGAYVNGIFRIASMTHIKDANGEPTSMIIMPGDEIDVVWTLIIARPAYLDGFDALPVDFIESNIYNYSDFASGQLDYEMLSAYPNWHLMGVKRMFALIAERNSLITKTVWNYMRETNEGYINSDLSLSDIRGGFLQLKTNGADPLYEVPKNLFVPSLLGPVKMKWTRQDTYFNPALTIQMKSESLYSRWQSSFRTVDSQIEEPHVVNMLDVNYTTSASNYAVLIHTTPYVLLTVYKNDNVVNNLLADEFGIAKFNVTRKGLLESDTYLIRAHVDGHQLTQTVNFPVPTTEPPNMIVPSTYVSGSPQYPIPHSLFFSVAASLIGKTYKIAGRSELVADSRTYAPYLAAPYPEYGDITRSVNWQGEFKVGDKYTVELREKVTNTLVQSATYEVKALDESVARSPRTAVDDQLLLSIQTYNLTV